MQARDISVGGNVNIKLNSESYDAVPDWDSFDSARGIECRGKFQIGGNIVMRNQDADHPWGIYVPYLKILFSQQMEVWGFITAVMMGAY